MKDEKKEDEYFKGYLDGINDTIISIKNYQVLVEKIKNQKNKLV